MANSENSQKLAELGSLTPDERRVLAVLVAVGGAALSEDQIASFGEVKEVSSILAALERRGLLIKDERGRHAVPAGLLGRLRRAVDVVETADRVLSQLISIAEDGRLTIDDIDAVLGITRWAAEAGRLQPLLHLVTEVERAVSFSRRVEAWLEVVNHARQAARALGDREAEAWANEQLQVCERVLGNARPAARARQADETAVLRSSSERPPRLWVTRIGAATLALAAAGVAGYAVASAPSGDQTGDAGLTTTLSGQTVTAPGETVTLPGSTITAGGLTVTLPGRTVRLPGETVTVPRRDGDRGRRPAARGRTTAMMVPV